MHLSLRFLVPLVIALAAIAYSVVPLVDQFTLKWFLRDLDTRAAVIAKATQDQLATLMGEPQAKAAIPKLLNRIIEDERVYAVGFCDAVGKLRFSTAWFPGGEVRCRAENEPQ